MTDAKDHFKTIFRSFKMDGLAEIDLNKFRPMVNLWLKAKYSGKVT